MPHLTNQKRLGQYFTPQWAAEIFYDRYYRHLTSADHLLDPSAGDGAVLLAVPDHVDCFGVELDPRLAAQAAQNSGRSVLVGDFRTIMLPQQPTAILGNPPFQAALIDAFIQRGYDLLPEEGQMGYLLPAYFLQTSHRVVRYAERWSIETLLLPRDLYPRLKLPIIFALFRKSRRRALIGLTLFHETAFFRRLPPRFQALLTSRSRSLWLRVVEEALRELGGEGSLQAIYRVIEGRRPTANPWWNAKIRQVLQLYTSHFTKLGPAFYRLHTTDETHENATLFAHACPTL